MILSRLDTVESQREVDTNIFSKYAVIQKRLAETAQFVHFHQNLNQAQSEVFQSDSSPKQIKTHAQAAGDADSRENSVKTDFNDKYQHYYEIYGFIFKNHAFHTHTEQEHYRQTDKPELFYGFLNKFGELN